MDDARSDDQDTMATTPIRVLVETATHLVPGAGYSEKLNGMLDRICQHQWGCEFRPSVEDFRWGAYGTKFAYENRRCYFVMDRGLIQNGDQLRVLWYKWTGSTFKLMHQPLPDEIRAKLESFSFNSLMPERPADGLPPRTPEHMPKRIRKKVRSDWALSQLEIDFLADHPEAVTWLKAQLEPWLWPKLNPPENMVARV